MACSTRCENGTQLVKGSVLPAEHPFERGREGGTGWQRGFGVRLRGGGACDCACCRTCWSARASQFPCAAACRSAAELHISGFVFFSCARVEGFGTETRLLQLPQQLHELRPRSLRERKLGHGADDAGESRPDEGDLFGKHELGQALPEMLRVWSVICSVLGVLLMGN